MKKQTYITTIASILLLFAATSCIPQKDLYEGGDKDTGNGSGGGGVIPDNSPFYSYPFKDEIQGARAEITIHTAKAIHSDNVLLEIPCLKYNKSSLIMLTQDDSRQSTYCRTWAAIHGRPISNSIGYPSPTDKEPDRVLQLYYSAAQLRAGDLPFNIMPAIETLGSTDGVGNEVRFAVTATVGKILSTMDIAPNVNPGFTENYYRFFGKSGLVWNDIIEMINYGTGIAFHNVDALDERNQEEVLIQYGLIQDVIQRRLSGRGCKVLARPDGNNTYINAALQYPTIQTMVVEGGSLLYPFKVMGDLNRTLLSREFNDSPNYFKEKIETEYKRSQKERQAILIGAHETGNDWIGLLQWINNTYGKGGDDSVWFPSQEEYYEYTYYRNHATTAVEQVDDNTIRLIIDLPAGEFFYYPSITLNVQGVDMQDVLVTSNDVVKGLSYGKYGDNGLMLNIDCRKHLLEHATHYVELYEYNRMDYYKMDAIYFVNMLKDSPEKTKLLERIK